MSVGVIYAVHGFLGEAVDWKEIRSNLKTEIHWSAVDLFKTSVAVLEAKSIANEISKFSGKKIFVGYSFGGRAGLKLLFEAPDLFDHYIFISVNPGFATSDSASRELRLIQDKKWADKISLENWESFISDWNQQPIFLGGVKEPSRQSESFNLQSLKDALVDKSLGAQPDYTDLIRTHSKKITWVVGDRDPKYVAIAENLKIDFVKIESGHRILFDNPVSLAAAIDTQISKLN